jgi:long-chain acyl-CoA synthetase
MAAAHCSIYLPPVAKGTVILGRTVPALLDEGCERFQKPGYGSVEPTLKQWTSQGWQSWGVLSFRVAAEELAMGLRTLGLAVGDRVGLLLPSGVSFALADMACLLAGLVDVPIDLEQPSVTTGFMLQDAQTRALFVSDWGRFRTFLAQQLIPESLQWVVMAEDEPLPLGHDVPSPLQATTMTALQALGHSQLTPEKRQWLRQSIQATDLATLVYTPDASGQPQGAMLTHENLSADIWAAFSSMPKLEPGVPEVALSFLPLNHVFARSFLYGHYCFGHSVYFSTPQRVMRHLAEVKPTIFITVPRLLEKVHDRFEAAGLQLKGWRGALFRWGWQLADQYPTRSALRRYRLQLALARWLVFRPLRRLFGDRLRYFISGGAALKPEIISRFQAAGLPLEQGYGLTETSSVVTYTRAQWSQPGTVGAPIPGVEIRLADDGEILIKSPYTMQGYYHNPTATQAVLDADGWLHTGDYGSFSEAGLLTITGCKKALFKLSTGKYVTPQPLESHLQQSPLVRHAVIVGPQRKFCAALIFPDLANLQREAIALGLRLPLAALLSHPAMRERYQQLIDQVNTVFPEWSKVKRFGLLDTSLSAELGELSADGTVVRSQVYQRFATVIDDLYQEQPPGPITLPPQSPPIPWPQRLLNPLKGFAH